MVIRVVDVDMGVTPWFEMNCSADSGGIGLLRTELGRIGHPAFQYSASPAKNQVQSGGGGALLQGSFDLTVSAEIGNLPAAREYQVHH
jgi:hypothetical protein